MRLEQPIDVPEYRQRPILRQFPIVARHPIKAVAGSRSIPWMRHRASATFGPAQALVTCSLPHTKQNRECLENNHLVTFFDQLASERGAADIADPSNRTRTESGAPWRIAAPIKGEDDMNTGLNQGSATIYQFPVGGRASIAGRRYGETRSALEIAASQVNKADCSGSWYHEAAIQESKPARDH
jgi:uncharacterized protein DUF2735